MATCEIIGGREVSLKNQVSTKRRSILNFITISAAIVTIGAILSPLAIAWWQRTGITTGLASNQAASLKKQLNLAEKLLQEQPENQSALKYIVDANLQLADIKSTIKPLERLASLNPQTPDYMVLLGQTQQYLGDREAAVTTYRRVLSSSPQNISALQGLASVLVDGNKPEAAIGAVQEAIKFPIPAGQTADLGSMKLLLGQIYASQKRYGDSLTLYNELIQANGQDFRPLLARAIVLKQMGSLNESQALLAQAVELAPAQYKDQIQTLAKSNAPSMLNNPALNAAPVTTPATSSPSSNPNPGATPATPPPQSSGSPVRK
jgi:tetratricopeptide (TPR) repeat protein